MAYKSEAQRKYLGGMSKKMARGGFIDEPSEFNYLPRDTHEGNGEPEEYESYGALNLYHGGEVGDPSLYVPMYEDSSGEPNEEDEYEEEHPMEYMFAGGGIEGPSPESVEAKKILMSHGKAEAMGGGLSEDMRSRKPLPHFAKGGFVKALKMRGYR